MRNEGRGTVRRYISASHDSMRDMLKRLDHVPFGRSKSTNSPIWKGQESASQLAGLSLFRKISVLHQPEEKSSDWESDRPLTADSRVGAGRKMLLA